MNRKYFKTLGFLSVLLLNAMSVHAGLNFCGGPGVTSNVTAAFSQDTFGTPGPNLIYFNSNHNFLLSYTQGVGAYDSNNLVDVFSCPTPPVTTAVDCGDPLGTRWVNRAPVSQPPLCFCKSYVKMQFLFGGNTPVSPTPNQPLAFSIIAFHNPGDTSVVPNIPSYNRTTADVLELQNFPNGINNDKFVSFTNPGQWADGFFGGVMGQSNASTPGQILMEITTIYDPNAAVSSFLGDIFFYGYHPGLPINNQIYNCDIWLSDRLAMELRP